MTWLNLFIIILKIITEITLGAPNEDTDVDATLNDPYHAIIAQALEEVLVELDDTDVRSKLTNEQGSYH